MGFSQVGLNFARGQSVRCHRDDYQAACDRNAPRAAPTFLYRLRFKAAVTITRRVGFNSDFLLFVETMASPSNSAATSPWGISTR